MRRFYSCAVIFLIVFARSYSEAQTFEISERGPELAERVHAIFEAKRVDCHGLELSRPKGKFGYVLDLKRLPENPDYVVKGKAEKSEVYLMLRDDEMPGKDANVPPLTPDEKEIVRRWIAIYGLDHYVWD